MRAISTFSVAFAAIMQAKIVISTPGIAWQVWSTWAPDQVPRTTPFAPPTDSAPTIIATTPTFEITLSTSTSSIVATSAGTTDFILSSTSLQQSFFNETASSTAFLMSGTFVSASPFTSDSLATDLGPTPLISTITIIPIAATTRTTSTKPAPIGGPTGSAITAIFSGAASGSESSHDQNWFLVSIFAQYLPILAAFLW